MLGLPIAIRVSQARCQGHLHERFIGGATDLDTVDLVQSERRHVARDRFEGAELDRRTRGDLHAAELIGRAHVLATAATAAVTLTRTAGARARGSPRCG